ncbi:MAG: DUF2271 domain-containing protein [Oceanisphaera sp.]|uniref:Tat pathway signal protein n=1 Tax=Oceanisphaera profunda TaxID=1416627 RepID=A0A1Y0D2I9_9GAMM|nr:DUF2271 domain-containing protein [Oceanisphaera profunda]ART81729.1 Tat pathway signal protein [Oceanisphaera profunda]
MKKTATILALTALLTLPSLAQAKPVTLTTELNGYNGDGAYVAIYLTDANGKYQDTLWVAGGKSKYYKHLRDWARGSGLKAATYDGKTGASLASGNTLTTTVEVADKWLDAGYQLRIDTAVEDLREHRAEVIAPFTRANAGQVTSGKGYVKSFSYQLQ